jgi:signal transduction histidine kinase
MELLISDLLALSRLGRVVATFKDVSLSDVIDNVVSDLQDKLKSISVQVVVADNLPVIHCDGERLYQVFDNLIGNAIKFQRTTEDPIIEIGYEQKGEFHQFFVKDNGIGIDPKYHHKIFERFYRLKETEDEEGTGLGLAIIERIVNNHGGRVWVESNRGEGAAFYFTIPLEP